MAHNQRKFSFVSQGLSPDTFAVVRFKGSEALSTLYRFEIMLIAVNEKIDPGKAVEHPATLTIHREKGDDINIHGVLATFETMHKFGKYAFYAATLVPVHWQLTWTMYNEIFLKKNIKNIAESIFSKQKLNSNVSLKLEENYQERENVTQYNETYLNFLSYWFEYYGIYYFFDHDGGSEKMVIVDKKDTHSAMKQGSDLTYAEVSGLDFPSTEELVRTFNLKQIPLPKTVEVNDYNYRKPSLDLKCTADVDSKGAGTVYLYNEHYVTKEEGQTLAKLRAEEYKCRKQLFHGMSSCPYLRSGYTFSLKNHFRSNYNAKYLVTEVTHEGNQELYLEAGLGIKFSGHEAPLFYRNTFTAIPESVQFRPERKTKRNIFHGSLSAKVDAQGSDQYAKLDDKGRYKLIMPFDLSGRKDGKASEYVRKTQPYGGGKYGMHFPLHKGTEVLVNFIDGNPDRPVITGALFNEEKDDIVNNSGEEWCKITSGGKNEFHIYDKASSQCIQLYSPGGETFFRIGTGEKDKSLPSSMPSHGQTKKTGTASWGDFKCTWSKELSFAFATTSVTVCGHHSVHAAHHHHTYGGSTAVIGKSGQKVICKKADWKHKFKKKEWSGKEFQLETEDKHYIKSKNITHHTSSEHEIHTDHLKLSFSKLTSFQGETQQLDLKKQTTQGKDKTTILEKSTTIVTKEGISFTKKLIGTGEEKFDIWEKVYPIHLKSMGGGEENISIWVSKVISIAIQKIAIGSQSISMYGEIIKL